MAIWQEVTTPGRFEAQTVIVTGAASGIGLATALRVAREGGRVIASDLSEEGLEKLVAEHSDLGFVPVAGDISQEDTVQRVAAHRAGRLTPWRMGQASWTSA
jgi:NAD(P)-dependent dehydrogenase (short-subunit alcohol dehydrogenase family)